MAVATSKGFAQTAAGEGHILCLPRLYKPDGTKRCIVVARAAAGTHMDSLGDVRTLADDMGLPAIAADFGATSGGRWGTDGNLTKITAAWTYMKNNYGVKTDKLVFATSSGGGIDGLAWTKANPTLVAALSGFIPAIGLADIHDNVAGRSATYNWVPADIETKYGGLSAYNAAVAAKDPNQNRGSYTGIPMYLAYSSDDPVCIPSIATSFAASVGSSVTLQNMGAGGHGQGPNYDGVAFTTWMRQYANA